MPTPQITLNSQHIAIGLNRLLLQFQGRPRFAVLLAALLNEVQEVENALYGLLVRALDNPAVGGVTLDAIGRIVGQSRQGQADAAYVPYLQARIKTNFSDGRLETILSILLFLIGASTPIIVREYPKALELEADGVVANAYQVWSQFLELSKDAGTRLLFVFSGVSSSLTLKMTTAYPGSSFTTVLTQRMDTAYVVGGGGLLAGVLG